MLTHLAVIILLTTLEGYSKQIVHFEVNEYSEHTLTPEVSVPKMPPVSTKTTEEKKLEGLGYHVFSTVELAFSLVAKYT